MKSTSGILKSSCFGGVAQLGERLVRNQKVGSSILPVSTTDMKARQRLAFFISTPPGRSSYTSNRHGSTRTTGRLTPRGRPPGHAERSACNRQDFGRVYTLRAAGVVNQALDHRLRRPRRKSQHEARHRICRARPYPTLAGPPAQPLRAFWRVLALDRARRPGHDRRPALRHARRACAFSYHTVSYHSYHTVSY